VTGLTKSNLLLNQNIHGIGTGSGLCEGDSGSPQLLPESRTVISVTSGGNRQCNANDANYRVDTAVARDFLGDFLDLP
jgi:secreted trypsin-like serine protease